MSIISEYLKKEGYDFSKPTKVQQYRAEREYGNLDKEIVSLNDTLTDLFTSGEWRDAPTMKGYSDSLSSTLGKVKGYKDYITKYHANDKGAAELLKTLSDTESYYTGATDNLNYLTSYYGSHTNAKSFADQKAKDEAQAAKLAEFQRLAKNADFADRSVIDEDVAKNFYKTDWYKNGTSIEQALFDSIVNDMDVSAMMYGYSTNSLTDEEKALYRYIAQTEGVSNARDYIDTIADTLNYRKGKEIANSWAGRNLPILTSLVSGVDSASEGLINAANSLINPNKERPTSAMQYAGGLIGQREMEEGVVQGLAAQISQSIGQMTPQILVSLATGNVGGAAKGVASAASKILSMATLGASVYGNAYNEALQRGQDGWRAYGYGLGNAAVEIAAESFADGINLISSGSWGKALATKLTGNKFKAVTEIVAEIADKPRIKYLLDALGEGAEEVFSTALEPALESFFLKETFDPASVEEMLYSGLLGALTSGVMNAPGLPGQVANYKYYSGMNQTLNDADIDTIRAEAMQMGEDSKSYNAAKEFEGVEAKDLANRHRRRILEAFNTENREKTNEIVGNAFARNYAESEKVNDNVDKAAEKAAEMKGKYNTATDGKAYTKDGTEADFSDFTETVEIDDEGNAVFTAEDGRTLSTADDVVPEIVAEGVAMLANLPSIPKSAYSTYFQYLPKQTNTKAYTEAFETLFEMGKNAEGMKLATSAAFADAELDELSQGAIYLQGVNTRKSADEAFKDAVVKARSAAEKNGKFNAKKGKLNDKAVRDMKLTRAQKNAITMLSSFTEFGINVEIYASTEANRKNTPNGWFDSTTGTIHLDINAGQNADVVGSGVFWTIAHESTHMIKVTAPEAYKVLQEYVLDEMFKTEDALNEAIGNEMMRHDRQHPNEPKMSRADAIEEIVARSCESIFADSDQLTKMLIEGEARKEGFVEKVIDILQKIVEKITAFFQTLSSEYNPESKEGKFFSETAERTLKLKEIYDNAFAEAVEGAKVVYGTEGALSEDNQQKGAVKYSNRKKSEKALDKYSEKEYNNFGWARVNGILSARENADLRSKFAAVISGHITLPKTHADEYMIAIGDDVENKIVYMKGKIDDPIITRILKINETDETKLSEIRRETYAFERRGIQRKAGELCNIYTATSLRHSEYQQGKSISSERHNNQLGAERSGSGAETKRFAKFTVKEDGTIVTTYADGSVKKYSDRSTQRDAEYLDAVKRGDMETAQRMVDEAAKEAGYNSPKLYHGTSAFGFTRIDKKKLSDRISFFATDSIQTAGTYSGTSDTRNISEANGSSLGVYQLYANTNGMLEFDAKGAESNHIELGQMANDFNDFLMGKSWYSYATAKQIAKYAKQKGYPGVIIKNVIDTATPDSRKSTKPANVYIFLNAQEQVKSADAVTYDDNGNVIPLSERFKSENADIRYSDRRPNRDREILAEVIGDSKLQQKFYYYKKEELKKYDNALESYNKALAEVNRIENEIRQLPRGNTQNSRVKKLKKSLEFYYGRLQAAEEKMFTYEAEGLRDVIDSEINRLNEVARKTGIESRREAIHERVERASRAAQISTISNYVKKTLKLFEGDTKKQYVPEVLKAPIVEFLTFFDFTKAKTNGGVTQQSARLDDAVQALLSVDTEDFDKVIADFEQAVKDNNFGEDTFAFDLNEDVVNELKEKFESIKAEIKRFENLEPTQRNIYNMDAEALADLKDALRTIYTIVKQANTLIASGMSIADAANGTIDHIKGTKADVSRAGTATRKAYFSLVDPIRFFSRLGSEAAEIFRQLRIADSRRAFMIKRVQDFLQTSVGAEKIKAWKKETHKIDGIPVLDSEGNVIPGDGETIEVTTTQLMALYAHWRRDQSRKHLADSDDDGNERKSGGGVFRTKHKSGEDTFSERIRFSQEIFDKMTSVLTDEQKDVVVKLQNYMSNEISELGNMVTMKRFGLNAFTEKNYIPIVTRVGDVINEEGGGGSNLLKIINKSWTKKTNDNASNTIIIDDFFDVFSKHVAEMIDYNAFAIPLLDAVRWLNFKETANGADKSVRASLKNSFGNDGVEFIKTLIEDINGSSAKPSGGIGMQKVVLRNVKTALVGGKLKQIFLQPTSIVRAAEILGYNNLLKAVGILGKTKGAEDNVNKTFELATKWSGVALWKSMGYIDVNMSGRTFAETILYGDSGGIWNTIKDTGKSLKNKEFGEAYENAIDLGLKPMEIGDKYGWAMLWKASEYKVSETRKNLVPKSDEYYKAVAEVFDDAVYKTQVTDSVLSKASVLRAKNGLTTISASFMSEPIKSLEWVLDSYAKFVEDTKTMGVKAAFAKNKGNMLRAMWGLTASSIITAVVTSAADTFGDDEESWLDYKIFLKKFFGKHFFDGNLWDELDPLRKIPYVNEIVSIFQKYDPSRLDLESFNEIEQAVTALINYFSGKGNYTGIGVVVQTLEALALTTGLPIQNVVKDIKDVWNATVGEAFEDYEIKEKKK